MMAYTWEVTLQLELPLEVVEALGPRAERELLEAALLKLVSERKMTLAKAGRFLGMSRLQAIRWYTKHGLPYPNIDIEDFAKHDLKHAGELADQD
jgi:hypothetical protein